MKREFLVGLGVTLAILTAGRLEAIMIPVNCGGNPVGTIDVNVHGSGLGVAGGFTSSVGGPPPTLAAAAAACGEHHFNWYQIVTGDNMPPVDPGLMRLTPPYVDPPPGGYGNDPVTPGNDTQWADQLPWYWDEGADPPAGTPGFSDGLNVNDQSTASMLRFSDFPGGLAGTILSFNTWLVSLNADGSFHSWHPGFSWTWNNVGGVVTTGAPVALGASPTAAEYNDLIGGFRTSLPEPASGGLFAIALAALSILNYRRRDRS